MSPCAAGKTGSVCDIFSGYVPVAVKVTDVVHRAVRMYCNHVLYHNIFCIILGVCTGIMLQT
jgi:hypothetical protein